MTAQALADALEHLVKGIVDRPERVRVDARETSRGGILEVRVHPADLGRVIGRGGRTAQSLRTVIGSLADGDRVRIDVVDTDDADEAEDAS
ncbi:RNA-binding protein [Leucobacter sp. CSA1]|uniref:RNA-binding protein KhpA n=1 Tax=Leucobacter chromiisoli TaxID=2796471 RepID=A0A934Q5V2_9MICO|nr:RNA-binding protein [Leucobacter chromiisoli]MBK0418223.1 RNA-binding protein [Leucobacter chromiisoli]